MITQEKIKICYILPEYDPFTPTHFYHKYALLKAIEDEAEVRLVSAEHAWLGGLLPVLYARIKGFRNFYVHYSFKGAFAALAVTRLFGGRVLYWNCGMPWLYARSDWEERIFRFVMRKSIFVTGTPGLLEEYIRRYGLKREQTRVLPNAIDTKRFGSIAKEEARDRLRIVPDKKVVLFNHRLSKRKGADKLPAIIREFKNRSSVLFVVIGSGPYEPELRQELGELEMPDAVRLEGAVPNEGIADYLAAADVYLMPSEEEGFPNALLEAMAAGVSFVASDVGGVRDITPPELHELIVSPDDVYGFTRIISRLLDSPAERKQISAISQAWVERYDITKIAPDFLDLFREERQAR